MTAPNTAAVNDALQVGLIALFAALMEIPCQWEDKPRKFQGTAQAWIDITGAPVGVGVDERVTEAVDVDGNPTTDNALAVAVRETILGIRLVTLTVKVWSNRGSLSSTAHFFLDRLRTRIRWSSSMATLKSLGWALVDFAPGVRSRITFDGRDFNQATMDIRFTYGISETDAQAPFIQTTRVHSDTINRADGTPEPDALQQDFEGPP